MFFKDEPSSLPDSPREQELAAEYPRNTRLIFTLVALTAVAGAVGIATEDRPRTATQNTAVPVPAPEALPAPDNFR